MIIVVIRVVWQADHVYVHVHVCKRKLNFLGLVPLYLLNYDLYVMVLPLDA